MIIRNLEDLLKPISETWKNLDYKNLILKNKMNLIIRNKKLIHNFDEDIDECILHALRNYYENLNAFVIFGKNKNEAYKYYLNNFKEEYSLYGIKHIELNSSIIPKIMYQLLFPRHIFNHKSDLYNMIEEKYNFLHKSYENKENIHITILLVCKKDLNKKYPHKDIIDKNFYIYIPNTKEEIWHTASVFFCNSTLRFLEKQAFDFFLIKEMEQSKKMFLKYRSWININIDMLHMPQFMLFSSVILYLLGHRTMNDLDLYVHTVPIEIQEKLNEFNENKVYDFIEFKIKNTENWPNYWNIWLDTWAKKCGAKYFEEILGNPKYHFYFLGVKIISLECDVVRRLERNRPRAVADLIALRKRYSYHINIPVIPKEYNKYIDISDKNEIEIERLIKNCGIMNSENKEISIVCKTDVDKFIKTIIYALDLRYRMKFSESDIKRELKMDNEDISKIERKYDNIQNNKTVKIIVKRK